MQDHVRASRPRVQVDVALHPRRGRRGGHGGRGPLSVQVVVVAVTVKLHPVHIGVPQCVGKIDEVLVSALSKQETPFANVIIHNELKNNTEPRWISVRQFSG